MAAVAQADDPTLPSDPAGQLSTLHLDIAEKMQSRPVVLGVRAEVDAVDAEVLVSLSSGRVVQSVVSETSPTVRALPVKLADPLGADYITHRLTLRQVVLALLVAHGPNSAEFLSFRNR
jgi:hypothetical protein